MWRWKHGLIIWTIHATTGNWIIICLDNGWWPQVPCHYSPPYTQIARLMGANTGPTWALSSPGGPHVGPMKLAIRNIIHENPQNNISPFVLGERSGTSNYIPHIRRDVIACACPYKLTLKQGTKIALLQAFVTHFQPFNNLIRFNTSVVKFVIFVNCVSKIYLKCLDMVLWFQ